jgi:ribonuclease P protein component
MGSGSECGPAPGGVCLLGAAPRAGPASRPDSADRSAVSVVAASPRHERRSRQGLLSRGVDIRLVLDGGTRWSGRRMVVYVMPGEQGFRAGFVCGRRVGGAVARNRARRLLKEAWRASAPLVQDGFDIVFVARPDIRGARTQDVIADMTRMLTEAGMGQR